MSTNSGSLSKTIKTILWGNSVALAWTWGIGLFFSVQVAIQFGFKALLAFATVDAIGLTLFGVINSHISKKYNSAQEFEASFFDKAKNFKLALLLYQFLAITLTIFCCLKYVSLPLGILSILVGGMFFGATIFMGEEFDIRRIKYTHAVYSIIIFSALAYIFNSSLFTSGSLFTAAWESSTEGLKAQFALNTDMFSWLEQCFSYKPLYKFESGFSEFAFFVPILIGFICGPWLDLQNWHRVVQIKKEGASMTGAYIIGGLIFWTILVLDGLLAIACFKHGQEFLPTVINGLSNLDPASMLYQVKSTITQVLAASPDFNPLLGLYVTFVGFAALSTFDSGYISYKWYSESLVKDSNNLIFSLIPPNVLSSPVLGFVLCVVTATTTLHFSELGKFIAIFDASLQKFFSFELEYYLAFYAAFFIVYAVTFFRNAWDTKHNKSFSGLKLFSTALSSIAVFGIGYFSETPLAMAFGSLLPFIYGWYTVTREQDYNPKAEAPKEEPKQITQAQAINLSSDDYEIVASSFDPLMEGAEPVGIKGCFMKDGWFCHSFIPTYQDTNSVGNVYFAMYALWVGKTRELFFLKALPNFDPKTSEYLILTKNFEHKFLREINEFTNVVIKLRIGDYNRKFVTLNHQIEDEEGNVIGKGKQQLMFVDSKEYGLLNLPAEVTQAFLPFVGEVKEFLKG